MAAQSLGHVVGTCAYFNMGIGRGARKCAAPHHRQVGPVVPDGCGLVPAQAQRVQGGLGSGALVFGAVVGMHYAQRLQACAQNPRVAPGDHHGCDARALQQFDAVAVQRVEAFDGFTGCGGTVAGAAGVTRGEFRKIQSAVGQHTVHVEKSDTHVLRLEQQFGRKRKRGQHRRMGHKRQGHGVIR